MYHLALRFSGSPADAHVADPAFDPTSRVEYDELCAEVRLSCTYGMLLCLSRDQQHAGVVLPIETTTLEAAAREFGYAEAIAEVYRAAPSFAAPASVWEGLVKAMPTLLSES